MVSIAPGWRIYSRCHLAQFAINIPESFYILATVCLATTLPCISDRNRGREGRVRCYYVSETPHNIEEAIRLGTTSNIYQITKHHTTSNTANYTTMPRLVRCLHAISGRVPVTGYHFEFHPYAVFVPYPYSGSVQSSGLAS